MAKISFVIPLYNEAANVDELHKRLMRVLAADFKDFDYEIIMVDDGSADDTFRSLESLHGQNPKLKVVQFSRNFGHHIAITAGLDMADGDYVVMMDGDLQDQPEEVKKLYAKLNEGYDVVYGERMNKKFSWIKCALSHFFNSFMRALIREPIVINSTIFRIMTRQVADSVKLLKEHNRYILGIVGWVGFKQAGVAVEHGARFGGESKYNFSRQLDLALNAIFSFSHYPLRLVIKTGLVFVGFSIVMAGWVLYNKLIYHTSILGWSSIMLSILMIGGIQIIILGVIGEYVGRNYMETKNRPLYIVRKIIR